MLSVIKQTFSFSQTMPISGVDNLLLISLLRALNRVPLFPLTIYFAMEGDGEPNPPHFQPPLSTVAKV